VNTRKVATGTVLTASLLLGGAGLAEARPNTSAFDRGQVPSCQRIENRLDTIQDNLDRLEARLTRQRNQLVDAQARASTAEPASCGRTSPAPSGPSRDSRTPATAFSTSTWRTARSRRAPDPAVA
jgi:hypothetical protein